MSLAGVDPDVRGGREGCRVNKVSRAYSRAKGHVLHGTLVTLKEPAQRTSCQDRKAAWNAPKEQGWRGQV